MLELRSRQNFSPSRGFSLLELVVVIAILGVLTAIALPRFVQIQKDAKIAQAKNVLVSILKECKIADLRGKSLLLKDIASANGKISSYLLKSGTVLSSSPAFFNRSCFALSNQPLMSIAAQTTELDPTQAYGLLPTFSITYNESTGTVSKDCFYEQASGVYYEGCLNGVFDGTQMKGSWD
jgi:prepilin-type N-terminal cleavage/methylation domain-containing protein